MLVIAIRHGGNINTMELIKKLQIKLVSTPEKLVVKIDQHITGFASLTENTENAKGIYLHL